MARVGNEQGSPGNTSSSILQSKIVEGTRTAVAGSGVQSITGAGFAPKAAVFLAGKNAAAAATGSVGFVDSSNGGVMLIFQLTGVIQSVNLSTGSPVFAEAVLNTDYMQCAVAFTSDGADLTWTKTGNGIDIEFSIMFLR